MITARRIFLCLVLLLGYLFLIVCWEQSKNGRYALHNKGELLLVIDTRTGEVSVPKMRPISGGDFAR